MWASLAAIHNMFGVVEGRVYGVFETKGPPISRSARIRSQSDLDPTMIRNQTSKHTYNCSFSPTLFSENVRRDTCEQQNRIKYLFQTFFEKVRRMSKYFYTLFRKKVLMEQNPIFCLSRTICTAEFAHSFQVRIGN